MGLKNKPIITASTKHNTNGMTVEVAQEGISSTLRERRMVTENNDQFSAGNNYSLGSSPANHEDKQDRGPVRNHNNLRRGSSPMTSRQTTPMIDLLRNVGAYSI